MHTNAAPELPEAQLGGYPESHSVSEWFPVNSFYLRHPHLLTKGGMAWLMRNREENGLDKCVVKIGRFYHLHEPSFLRWMDLRRGAEL